MVGQLPKEVGGSYTTGVCNVVYELSRCYNKEVEMYVYATNLASDKASRIQGPSKYFGTKMRYFDVIWNVIKNPLKSVKEWRYYYQVTHMFPIRCEFYKDNFIRLIKEVQPDLIHCMNIFQMAPLYFANPNHNIPIVLTLHGVFFDNDKNVEDLTKGNIQLADYTTGLTPETMRGIESLNFPSFKSFMIPNGTDINKFHFDGNERMKIRSILGVKDDTVLMITVASLQQRKGQLSFCKILNKMPGEFNYKYVIIGKGEDEIKINQFVRDNNLQEKIFIIGYVPNIDLYKYYSAADIYIHSSYEEGQALSEIEAYATGLKTAVNKDIIGTVITYESNPDNYFTFDYKKFDVQAFINWCQAKYENRVTRKQFDWNNILDMYKVIYNSIITQ